MSKLTFTVTKDKESFSIDVSEESKVLDLKLDKKFDKKRKKGIELFLICSGVNNVELGVNTDKKTIVGHEMVRNALLVFDGIKFNLISVSKS